MLNKFDKNKVFNRRLFIVLMCQLGLSLLLIVRFLHLQIFKFTKYSTLSDSNRIKSFIIPPLRGKILDRNNKVIATNSSYYRILLNPSERIDVDKTLQKLGNILEMDPKKFLYYTKKIVRKSSDGYYLIHDDLSWDEVAKVEVNAPDLPGIYIETAQRRYYPYNQVTSNIIGYVASVSEEEMSSSYNPLLNHPDFKIGKNGVEKFFENHLRGKAGLLHTEVDAYGYTIRNVGLKSAKTSIPGNDLKLTIDIDLQKQASTLVKDKPASIVVLDIETGKILTFLSSPSYDPNPFVSGISAEEWDILINNIDKPMINKPISNQYPPGSTFKAVVALAALENGYNPNKKINCRGKTRLGRRLFHCWKKEGHGILNFQQAFEQSCNVYYYNLGRQVGIKKIVKTAKALGLGDSYGISLPNERKGNLPTKEWKKKIFNEPWVLGDTYNSAIGQGFVEVTGLQLAVLTSRLVSQKKIIPSLIEKQEPVEAQFDDLEFNPENIKLILESMYGVVNKKKGTAYWQRLRYKNFKMAGKTGTSQVVAIDHKDTSKKEQEYLKRNHGLFIGFAPFDKPKYAISVVVEHGGAGSVSAAPIAKKLMQYIYKKEKA